MHRIGGSSRAERDRRDVSAKTKTRTRRSCAGRVFRRLLDSRQSTLDLHAFVLVAAEKHGLASVVADALSGRAFVVLAFSVAVSDTRLVILQPIYEYTYNNLDNIPTYLLVNLSYETPINGPGSRPTSYVLFVSCTSTRISTYSPVL